MADAPHRRQGVAALPYRGFAAFRFQLSTQAQIAISSFSLLSRIAVVQVEAFWEYVVYFA